MTRVVLHLEHVVVRGIRVDDLRAFAAGLERTLAGALDGPRLLNDIRCGAEAHAVQRQEIHLPHGASAGRVGQEVARGVAGALTP